MEFVAIDVETANADLASICQIGIAHFVDGKFCEIWESLVNPEDEFDFINISIHGIDESMVAGDKTDLRFLEGLQGKVIGLYAKGSGRNDQSGFVVTEADAQQPLLSAIC
jgi:DNA polymerase III epsilon subunit-like protein